jgi:hypothetical protein
MQGVLYGGDATDTNTEGELNSRYLCNAYVCMFAGDVLSWKSRLQPTVATSTTKAAEYLASGNGSKE